MVRLSAKVKASTLIEVIIAMVVILVVFALSMGIYTNVLRTSSSLKGEQIKAMTSRMLAQSVTDKNWNDVDSLQQDSILLQKRVLPYDAYRKLAADGNEGENSVELTTDASSVTDKELNYSDLIVITVTAFTHEKQVGQTRSIVKKTSNED